MNVFTAEQIRKWEAVTLHEQQISSVDLMERAALACTQWLIREGFSNRPVWIFCGKGNNGGDGLAIARLLLAENVPVTTFILETGKSGSEDFQYNLARLHLVSKDIHFIQSEQFFPKIPADCTVVDALFGTGLHSQLSGIAAQLVTWINLHSSNTIAIDLPSGMYADEDSSENPCITATHTLSFQQYKRTFLFPESQSATGQVHILPIGLSSHFETSEPCAWEITGLEIIQSLLPFRAPFSHKGQYGHAGLFAGSKGMMGAALLAATAINRCGAGKQTAIVPECGYGIMQTVVPEAMCITAGENFISNAVPTRQFTSCAFGPGIGTDPLTAQWLKAQLQECVCAVLLDADALNIISSEPGILQKLPHGSVITPHPKEFERLFGKAPNSMERLKTAIHWAAALQLCIVLKGRFTAIVTPGQKVYFNTTGNAGMAKAGMGDVLSGIITGLMSRGVAIPGAAILGVYIHGLAGDIAAERFGWEAMQASDVVALMGEAWKQAGVS